MSLEVGSAQLGQTIEHLHVTLVVADVSNQLGVEIVASPFRLPSVVTLKLAYRSDRVDDCWQVINTHIGKIEVPIGFTGLIGHVRVYRAKLCTSIIAHVDGVAVVDEIEG